MRRGERMGKRLYNKSIKMIKYSNQSRIIYFVYVVFCAAIFPTIQVFYSLIQKYITNAIEFQNMKYMNSVYTLCIIVIALVAVINPVAQFLLERYGAKVVMGLRVKFEEKILMTSIADINKISSGELITRFTNDLTRVISLYSESNLFFLLAIFSGISSIGLMMFMEWRLALIIIVIGMIETYSITKFTAKVRKNSEVIQKKYGKLNEYFVAIIEGMKIVNIFSIRKMMLSNYHKENTDICNESQKRNNVFLLLEALNSLYSMLNIVGVLVIGIFLYLNQMTDLGTVMAFLVLQDGVSYMFQNIGSYFPSIQQSLICIERLEEIYSLKEEDDINCADESEGKLIMNAYIECNDISFAYDDKYVFKNISFQFMPGTITAIIGESGSGKTSFIKCLLGLQHIKGGSITLNDVNLSLLSNKYIRANISYVSQSPYIFSGSIMENIRCGKLDATDEEVMEASKAAGAHDFIMNRKNNYNDVLKEKGDDLSGGQKQRIALARAILKNAPILILDEATAGIDSETEELIFRKIEEMSNNNITVIIIAHRQSTINNAKIKYVLDKCS